MLRCRTCATKPSAALMFHSVWLIQDVKRNWPGPGLSKTAVLALLRNHVLIRVLQLQRGGQSLR